MRIAIIGAGATGLAAGYELTRRGHGVTVYERSEEALGGLAGSQTVAGAVIDKFYHHIFTSDADIISLIGEAGLSDSLVWKNAKNGIYCAAASETSSGGRIYPFTSPADLMRFPELSLLSRARTGLAVLRAKSVGDYSRLEDVSARDWLIKTAGRESYDKLWRPLLDSKFGEDADGVGGVWIWNKFKLRGSTRRGAGAESLGYLRGGFGVLYGRLAEIIRSRGGRFMFSEVTSVVAEPGGGLSVTAGGERAEYDKVLFTASPAELCQIAALPPEYAERARAVKHKANVCVTLVTKKRLSDYYWLTVAKPGAPFVLFIEHSNLFPDPSFGERGYIFLSRYLDSSDALFRASDDELAGVFFDCLGGIFPDFTPADVVDYRVHRAEYAQPVAGLRHSERILPPETALGGLYLASMAQIYPEDRGQNYAVASGRAAAGIICGGRTVK
ncbi:MAG: NAD(P)/FAD-dependent oxidoreductase [Oscillospiraceae bacterium]|jgi:protoporphyrinogen oxidase|nr:NAD(P)/FAD-dependent oxidoreductase [Oscillospiraceae bacterium]